MKTQGANTQTGTLTPCGQLRGCLFYSLRWTPAWGVGLSEEELRAMFPLVTSKLGYRSKVVVAVYLKPCPFLTKCSMCWSKG